MAGYRQVIIDTDVEVQQLANDLLNLPIDNMDIVISMYESITDTIQRWGSEMEASGKKLDKEYYQSLINNGMTVIDQYKEQYDLVRDVMDEYDTGSEKWNTLYNKLQSINSAMENIKYCIKIQSIQLEGHHLLILVTGFMFACREMTGMSCLLCIILVGENSLLY